MTLAQHPNFKHLFGYFEKAPEDAVGIPGFPDYAATRNGIIYDLNPGNRPMPTRPICHVINNLGYAKVSLRTASGKRQLLSAHRLVALTFIPNPDPLRIEIDHIDGNKLNNAVSNLRWVTHKENINFARQRLGNWTPKGNVKTCTPVTAFLLGNAKERLQEHKFTSLAHATTHFNKKYLTFSAQICRAIQKGWKCEGYLWERAA